MKKITLTKSQEERAQELHYSSLIIDGLCGNMTNPEPPERDGKSYLQRLEESGVRAMNITMTAANDGFEATLKTFFAYFNMFDYFPDRVMQVRTAADLERCHKEKKIGVIFGCQGSEMVGKDFYRWTILRNLGLRICQIAYNEPCTLASGCMDPKNGGLTFYGIQAVKEMNRLGIVVDLSHVGERSSLEAIELSTKPCIFSHSNAKSVTPTTTRNLTDEMIKAVAAKGGVVGLSSHAFLCHHELGVQPTLEDYMDHFEYMAKLVGTDHIGIGTDMFEYYTKFYWETHTKLFYDSPWFFETVFNADLKRVDQYINVTRGLVALGFSDEDIRKMLGQNFLRVFREVWGE